MNVDAIIISNYFYYMPDDALEGLAKCYQSEDSSLNALAKYINELPKDVFESMKRVLDVDDSTDEPLSPS